GGPPEGGQGRGRGPGGPGGGPGGPGGGFGGPDPVAREAREAREKNLPVVQISKSFRNYYC
ncbi:MAG: hypothetical protein ACKO3V_11275, partial [Pirellula sp.]